MEDAFGQMQCCSTDSAKLSVKFTVKLFWVISIMASDCHAYEKNGSILNGVDDDFSTPFFVFTKYLRNAIK